MSPQDGFGNKPPFKDKKFGDKKFGDKKFGDKKFGDKKFGDKKFGDKNNSLDMHGSIPKKPVVKFDRIAKVMARAGLCSRRDAERWIEDKRVSVNGRLLTTPAVKVTDKDIIKVDGKVIKAPEATRLWKYYKPAGLVTTHGDPEGRPTVFSRLRSEGLPRVVSIGRLDINTEGLILITNNGALARHLEMPSTGWQRKYRARAYGKVTQAKLDGLQNGVTIEGIRYGAILATLERQVGDNCWISLSLREGKNREIKEVLGSLGLQVNRLIRLSYGPFKLDNMERGTVEPITTKVLKDQLGDMFDEIDEGYDSELRPQDQVGYHVEKRGSRDRADKPKFDHKRAAERDDKRGGGERRDAKGGRSFGNDRSERRDGEKRYDKRPDGEKRFDRRPDGEKRPGRNNERPSYNRDRKERDDRGGRGGDTRGGDDTRGKRNDGRNPERTEYRGRSDARRDDKDRGSYGGKSAGFNKGKPGKSGTGHRERARGGKPAGNRSGAPRRSNSPRRDG
ncbi:MAG: pseudouridine synthase [Hyphomicrobiales bacterium]|nr:pseudouridine synthase [Hyphomicrobiales bacterium]